MGAEGVLNWSFAARNCCVALASLVPDAAVIAQRPFSRGAVEVLIRSAVDSVAIPFAGVVLDSGSTITADSNGRVVLHAVQVGRHQIVIRRPGYSPDSLVASVAADVPTTVTAWLRPVAQELEHVVVSAKQAAALQRVVGVADRARRNNGALFTAEQIDSLNPLRTKDLLGLLVGIQVNDRGVTFARCQGGAALDRKSVV